VKEKTKKRNLIKPIHVIWLLSLILIIIFFDTVMKPVLLKLGVPDGLLGPIPHFAITLLAVVVGAFIDRNMLFNDLNELLTERLAESEKAIVSEIRDEIIPMASDYGLSAIHSGLDIRHIISSLEPFDRIDIMFTFHPDFERYLQNLVTKVLENSVEARLLFGNPESETLKRRFRYITDTTGGFSWKNMIAKLQLFLDETIRSTIEQTRDFKRGMLFQVRTFRQLPDIPIVIIRSGNEQGPLGIKTVYQGFYLNRAAVELPVVAWSGDSRGGGHKELLADLLLQYFESRWSNASDLDVVDRPPNQTNDLSVDSKDFEDGRD